MEVHNQKGMVLVVPFNKDERVLKEQTIFPIIS
jgi:hypothetical protein